jgi:hypothetical protein
MIRVPPFPLDFLSLCLVLPLFRSLVNPSIGSPKLIGLRIEGF